MSRDLIRLMHALFLPAARTYRQELWRPSADVYRLRDGWLVKFDLAGVRPEDCRLSIQGGRLTVQGTRRDCFTQEECHHYLLEISYSHFERTLELPGDLEQAQLTTSYQDGMLLVRLQTEANRDD
jgi:HSP20 family protein